MRSHSGLQGPHIAGGCEVWVGVPLRRDYVMHKAQQLHVVDHWAEERCLER
jgi:hypothetical protein